MPGASSLLLFALIALSAANPREIDRLIRDLGNDSYAQREEASKALDAIGEPALDALRVASINSRDAEVRRRADALFHMIGGRELRCLKGHDGPVNGVVFFPGGNTVLSGGADGTCRVWDIKTGKEVRRFVEPAEIARSTEMDKFAAYRLHLSQPAKPLCEVLLSPDGRTALAVGAGKTSWLWDAKTGNVLQTLHTFGDSVFGAAMSPDGRHAVFSDKWALRLWDLKTSKEKQHVNGDISMTGLSFASDGHRVVAAGHSGVAIWDISSGKRMKGLSGRLAVGERMPMCFVARFSPDGQTVLAGSAMGIHLWDATNGELLRSFKGHFGPVKGVAFSPDGRSVLSGGADRTVRLRDMETERELRCFARHQGEVRCVAISPDGRLGASGSADGTVRLWRLK